MIKTLAVAQTLAIPAVYEWLSREIAPNYGHLWFTVGWSVALTVGMAVLAYWRFDPLQARRRIGTRLGWGGAATLALVILFLANPTPPAPPSLWAVTYADERPGVALYWLIWSGLQFAAGFEAFQGGSRLARELPNFPYMRMGMRALAVSGLLAMIWCYFDAVAALMSLADVSWLADLHVYRTARDWTVNGTVGSIALFVLLPVSVVVGTALHQAAQSIRLRPLWQAIIDEFPEITVVSRPAPGWLREWWRLVCMPDALPLHRRVIEIRDGYLRLRKWLSPDVADSAEFHAKSHGLSGERLSAAVEAAMIMVALETKKRGWEPPDLGEIGVGSGVDLSSEASWLVKVADAMRSPAVRAAVEHVLAREEEKAKGPRRWLVEQYERLGVPDPMKQVARGVASVTPRR